MPRRFQNGHQGQLRFAARRHQPRNERTDEVDDGKAIQLRDKSFGSDKIPRRPRSSRVLLRPVQTDYFPLDRRDHIGKHTRIGGVEFARQQNTDSHSDQEVEPKVAQSQDTAHGK